MIVEKEALKTWLVENNGFSEKSARDVVSRINRIHNVIPFKKSDCARIVGKIESEDLVIQRTWGYQGTEEGRCYYGCQMYDMAFQQIEDSLGGGSF